MEKQHTRQKTDEGKNDFNLINLKFIQIILNIER